VTIQNLEIRSQSHKLRRIQNKTGTLSTLMVISSRRWSETCYTQLPYKYYDLNYGITN